ncbi:MAG: hypothetical protein ACREL5_05315 [Gemmatimonadales bacterium]
MLGLLLGGMLAVACSNDVVPVPLTRPAQTADSNTVPAVDSTAADTVIHKVLPDSAPADSAARSDSTSKKPKKVDSVSVPQPLNPADTLSPTGRHPRLIWTAARQATWERMARENHPLYQLLVNKCQAAVNGSPVYGDRGLWCAILYQITGNVSYARVAWNAFRPHVTAPPSGGDEVREYLIESAILFDWLYPALSPDERETAVAGLNTWADFALGGIRLGDGDATIGYYFGLAAVDLATADLSPQHQNWLGMTQAKGSIPVGGLDATGFNSATLRNKVGWYTAVNGAGGEWDEGTEYNKGTQVLLAMGEEAVRTATGRDHFPEVTAYLSDAANAAQYFVTPDLEQTLQWGDIENPRAFKSRLFGYDTWYGVVAGINSSTAAGADAKGLLEALFAKYGVTGYQSGEPMARFFLFYNPYAPANAWSGGDMAKFFPGTGNLYVHTGGELFEARMANRTHEDHEVKYLSDFQLYRNGEWVLTHPLGYSGYADEPVGVNSLVLAGLNAMSIRGPEAVHSGSGWWSITGNTYGNYYDPTWYSPPPTFVRAARRTIVFLQRHGYDIVVVQDSVDADDPKSLGNLNHYNGAPDIERIDTAPGLLQFVMHAPVAPTIVGDTASWRTPGGQSVSVITLSPAGVSVSMVPEQSYASWSFESSELTGYQLRIIPAFDGGQIVMRHVIVVGASQLPAIQLSGNTISIDGTTVDIGGTTVTVTN